MLSTRVILAVNRMRLTDCADMKIQPSPKLLITQGSVVFQMKLSKNSVKQSQKHWLERQEFQVLPLQQFHYC